MNNRATITLSYYKGFDQVTTVNMIKRQMSKLGHICVSEHYSDVITLVFAPR